MAGASTEPRVRARSGPPGALERPVEAVVKIVCAYSGGLDTSVMVHWLKEHYDAEIVTYTGDLGQGDDLPAIREKALSTGAAAAEVEDLRERFLREFCFPAMRAGALYEGQYVLHTA